MKKYIIVLLLFSIAIVGLSACGTDINNPQQSVPPESSPVLAEAPEETPSKTEYSTDTEVFADDEAVFVGQICGKGLDCYLQLDSDVTYTTDQGRVFTDNVVTFAGKHSIELEKNCEIGKSVVIRGKIFDWRGCDVMQFTEYTIIESSGEGHGNTLPSSINNWEDLDAETVRSKAMQLFSIIMLRSGYYDWVDPLASADKGMKEYYDDGERQFYFSDLTARFGTYEFPMEIRATKYEVEFFIAFEISEWMPSWTYDWSGAYISNSEGMEQDMPEFLK